MSAILQLSTPQPTSGHWLAAIGVAIVLHGGVLLTQVHWPEPLPAPPNATETGLTLLPKAALPARMDAQAQPTIQASEVTAATAVVETALTTISEPVVAAAAAPITAASSIQPTTATASALAAVTATTVVPTIAEPGVPPTTTTASVADQVVASAPVTEATEITATAIAAQTPNSATAGLAAPIASTVAVASSALDVSTASSGQQAAVALPATSTPATTSVAITPPASSSPQVAVAVPDQPVANQAAAPSAAVSVATALTAPAVQITAPSTPATVDDVGSLQQPSPVQAELAVAVDPVLDARVDAQVQTALALPALEETAETAPVDIDVDAELTARIEDILSDEPCGRIGPPQQLASADSRRIEGIVSTQAGLDRLERELATVPGAPTIDLAVNVVAAPFCETLLALPIAVEGVESMELNNDDGLYLDGDLLALKVGPVPVSGQLYVVFVDHDGSVQHLVPSQFETETAVQAGDVRELGAEQDILDVLDSLGISIGNWRATEPFGRGLIMVFVTRAPLAPEPPAQTAAAEDYFDVLSQATVNNPVLWARYRWMDTRPRG